MTIPNRHQAADGTGRPLVDCVLCGSTLSPAGGQAARDRNERPIAFRSCPTCAALVPTPVDGGLAIWDDDANGNDGRLVDQVTNDAMTLAWAIAEYLPAPGDAAPTIDLGVGRGALADALQRLGYTVKGCEPSAFLCQMARASFLLGPDVLVNTDPDSYLDQLGSEPAKVAAVVLSHAIDRHPDPIGLLDRCRALVPDGLIVMEFPVVTSTMLVADQRFYPTPTTLVHLAELFDLDLLSASLIDEATLRVLYRVPASEIVDLDRNRGRAQAGQFDELLASYREVSQPFAQLEGESDGADPTTDADIGSVH